MYAVHYKKFFQWQTYSGLNTIQMLLGLGAGVTKDGASGKPQSNETEPLCGNPKF